MKMLFLDDCFRKDKKYLGHGGFCIDEKNVHALCNDILVIKDNFGIPPLVEIKWSPGRKHFLRCSFKGERKKLYEEVLNLLFKYDTSIFCAVHDLNDCYGVRLYNWDLGRSILWATKQQFKFIFERFESPYLKTQDDYGLVIADKYSNYKGEISLLKDTFFTIAYGNEYRKFKRICMNPLMAISRYCPPIQISDVIVGVVVSSLAGSSYAKPHFNQIGILFLKDPHENAIAFGSTLSGSTLGWGLKLFPPSLRKHGLSLFGDLDIKFVYTNEGVKRK